MLKMARLAAVFVVLSVLLVFGVSCTGSDAPDMPEKQETQPAAEQQSAPEEPGLLSAVVTDVVDGDTARVKLDDGKEETVRFIGVDTPESTREVEPYGKKAAAYTEKQLSGREVWLELDVEERDRYGRLLAYIWLEKPTDAGEEEEVRAKMFNAELLLNGCAQVMTVPPNVKYVDLFTRFQQEARKGNVGLWGLAAEEEEYYVASKSSKKFHRPDCKWGQEIKEDNLIIFHSRDDAFDAGYEPCRSCNP